MKDERPKYPKILVDHPGLNGDGYGLVLTISSNLSAFGASLAEVDQFVDEAFSGDYDDLIQTAGRWITWK